MIPGPVALGLSTLLAVSPADRGDPSRVVTVTATDYAFQAPDTIPAGLIRFRLINRGPGMHHIWLLRLDRGRRAVDVLKNSHERRLTPGWGRDLGGPNVPEEGGEPSVVSVTLEPGRYALLCVMPSDADRVRHHFKGMVKELTVVGPMRPTELPKPSVTATMVDHKFVLSAPLKAGPQVIAVRNQGKQSHMLSLLRLEPGKKASDYLLWSRDRKGPPPALTYGGTTGMAPGVLNTIHVDLEPGEYALMCFVPEEGDGRPHVAHGMIQQIRVL